MQTWKLFGFVLNKNNIKSSVTNFVNDGNKIANPQEIVEQFHDYFVNIGNDLVRSIPITSTEFSSYLENNNSFMDTFALFLTNSNEIIEIVNDVVDKSSFGYDNVPVNIMKKCITQIAEPLSAIINSSFRTGKVSDSLKIAKVCPVFKNGAEDDFLITGRYLSCPVS